MSETNKAPRAQGAGRFRAGERSDVRNITQSRPHFTNRFSDSRDLLQIHTEMREKLDKHIFGSMSDESFDLSARITEDHLRSQGLIPIWRKSDRERLRRIARERFLQNLIDQVGA